MFTLACPGCGAELSFRSATSAFAVCEYCRSSVLRDADAVRDGGKMAVPLEDYSPLRIATSGLYAGRAFGVVGRIQLRYEAGFWNEWYLLFDDGSAGWLADASGQYAVTLDTGLAEDAPPFGQIVPGGSYRWEGQIYTASDLRTARCTGGEGELPFAVGAGWEAKVADYRLAYRFLTLDYSEGAPPRRYAGKAVSLADLKCQLLREPDEIRRSAGHLKGRAETLACPACGAAIVWRPGLAVHLHCPACGAASEALAGTPDILAAACREAASATSLSLGDTARIDGGVHTLIGVMRCRQIDEAEEWVEYLLFSETGAFLWLVESSAGWDKVRVLDHWPESVSASAVWVDGSAFTRLFAYGAEVTHAAGAFNWRLRVGDKVYITDYRGARGTLTSERSAAEITWSLAQRVPASMVEGWFGKGGKLATGAPAALVMPGLERESLRSLAIVFTVVLLVINVPLAFIGGFYCLMTILLAVGILWLPVLAEQLGGA